VLRLSTKPKRVQAISSKNRYDRDNVILPLPMTIPRHTNITDHISIARLEYLDRQEALFDAAKPQLLTTHPGEFIAF
jgi:hypothetical protein